MIAPQHELVGWGGGWGARVGAHAHPILGETSQLSCKQGTAVLQHCTLKPSTHLLLLRGVVLALDGIELGALAPRRSARLVQLLQRRVGAQDVDVAPLDDGRHGGIAERRGRAVQ